MELNIVAEQRMYSVVLADVVVTDRYKVSVFSNVVLSVQHAIRWNTPEIVTDNGTLQIITLHSAGKPLADSPVYVYKAYAAGHWQHIEVKRVIQHDDIPEEQMLGGDFSVQEIE